MNPKLTQALLLYASLASTLHAGTNRPEGANKTLTALEDAPVSVVTSDFGFKDTKDSPPDTFTNVVISSLPAAARGTLRVNGAAATLNQVVRVLPVSPTTAWQVLGTVGGFGAHGSFASSNDGRRLIATFYDVDAGRNTLRTSTDSGITWVVRPLLLSDATVACSADGMKLAMAAYGRKISISSDGGETWTERASEQRWNAIAMSEDGTRLVAVVGTGGQIHTSADSGVTWTARESSRDWYTVACSASGTHMLASTYGGRLYVSSDSGATWTERESDRNWSSVAVSASGSRMIAGRSDGDIAISNDFGVTWAVTSSLNYSASVAISDDGQQILSTSAGDFLRLSTDGGVTWTMLTGTLALWRHVAMTGDGSRYFARTQGGSPFVYTSQPVISFTPVAHNEASATFDFQVEDSGSPNRDLSANTITFAYTPVNDAPEVATTIPAQTAPEGTAYTYAFPATTFTDPDVSTKTLTYSARLAGGAALPSWLSFNAATRTFSGTPRETNTGLFSIEVTARDNGVPPLSTSTTFDLTVTPTDNPPQGTTQAVLIAANQPSVLTPANFGFSDPLDAPMPHSFDALKITAPLPAAGTLLYNGSPVAAGDMVSMRRGTAGVAFVERNMVSAYAGIATSRDGLRAVALQDDYDPQISTNRGVDWTYPNYTRDVRGYSDLAGSADLTHLVACRQNNQLRVSNNFGSTWTSRGPTDYWRGAAVSADGSRMVAVTGIYTGAPNYVYDGGIYTSTDLGQTWTLRTGYSSKQQFSSVACSSDGMRIVVVANQRNLEDENNTYLNSAPILLSTDGGATWSERGTPQPYQDVACSASGAVMVACATLGQSGGYLFVSTDGGATWQQRESERRWSSVACSADGRRMFASDFGNGHIYRSEDFGSTWTAGGPEKNWVDLSCDAEGSILYGQNYSYLQISEGVAAPSLTFTPATGATGNNYAKLSFQVQDSGRDGQNLDLSANVLTLNIAPINNPPVLPNPLADQTVLEASPMLLTLPAGHFTDPNSGQTLTLSATLSNSSPLPAWLSFNPATRSFTGTPGNADVGTFEVALKATDSGVPTLSVTDTFQITVLNVDYPPLGRDATFTVDEGNNFGFNALNGTDFGFSDPGDAGAHSFSGLKITELPPRGFLYVNSQEAAVGDVFQGVYSVEFHPPLGAFGVPYGRIGFQVIDTGTPGMNMDPQPNFLTLNVNRLPVEIDVTDGGTPLVDGVSSVNFGTATLGGPMLEAKLLSIANNGPGVLDLYSISIDGPAADEFIIDYNPGAYIGANSSDFLQVSFVPKTLGVRQAVLHIHSDDQDEPSFDITLTAETVGMPEFAIQDANGSLLTDGSYLDFGLLGQGNRLERDLTLINSGTDVLVIQAAGVSGSDAASFSFPLTTPTQLTPGSRLTVPLRFTATDEGYRTAQLSVQTSVGSLTFELSGNVTESTVPEILLALPIDMERVDNGTPFQFADTAVGQTTILDGKITNYGTQPLKNFRASIAGAHPGDFTLLLDEDAELGGLMEMTFQVRASPQAKGTRSAILRIASNDPDENPFDIPVTVNASAPEIEVSLTAPPGAALVDGKGALNFGATAAVGSNNRISLTIRNSGNASLNFRTPQVVIDGPNASDFSFVPAAVSSLFPEETTTFDVFFNPTTPGARTAALHLLSDDGDEGAFDLKLTGTAVGPEISVELGKSVLASFPTSVIDFGTTLVGPANAVSRTLTVKNLGTGPLEVTSAFFFPDGIFTTTVPGGTFPFTLAPKASRNIVVTFSPSALGDFISPFSLSSNDYDESVFPLNLTGKAASVLSPSITEQPQPQIVALGQPATFTATVSTPVATKYQWSRGTPVKFTDIAKATTATLTLPAVTLADAAQLYRLRVSRSTDAKVFNDSQPTVLSVVDRAGSRRNLAEGSTATFRAIAASTAALSYLWQKDGADLPSDDRFSGGTTSTLTITGLEPEDAGIYTCVVSGGGGTLDNGQHVLTIFNAPPAITPDPLVLPVGIVSGDYRFTIPLSPTGGFATSYSSTTLPKGLSLNTTTGLISGRPTVASGASPFAFTLRAHNGLGTSEVPASLVIQAFPQNMDGSYQALISRSPPDFALGGRLDFTVTKGGGWSGNLTLGAVKTKLPPGQVNTEPDSPFATVVMSVPQKGLPTVEISLRIDIQRGRIIFGTASIGYSSSPVSGWRNVWSATRLSGDYDGVYNAAIQAAGPALGDLSVPQGHGFASCKVGTKGESVTFVGKMPDGDSFTSSGFLGPDGELAIFQALPSGGSLIGLTGIMLGRSPDYLDNRLSAGPLTWNRPASTALRAAVYKGGFSILPMVISGGLYTAPASVVMNRPAGPVAAWLSFSAAGLPSPSPADRWLPLSAGATLSISPAGLAQTSAKLARATGAFSGSFLLRDVHPVTPSASRIQRKADFQGLIIPLPEGQSGRGYFLLEQLPTDVFPPPPVLPQLSGAASID